MEKFVADLRVVKLNALASLRIWESGGYLLWRPVHAGVEGVIKSVLFVLLSCLSFAPTDPTGNRAERGSDCGSRTSVTAGNAAEKGAARGTRSRAPKRRILSRIWRGTVISGLLLRPSYAAIVLT